MATNVDNSLYCNFFSGGLAGLMADICVHPVDLIRGRLQVQGWQLKSGSRAAKATAFKYHYRSAFDAFCRIFRREGVKALYQGFGAVAVGTIPGHAFYFSGYELCKKFLNRRFVGFRGDDITSAGGVRKKKKKNIIFENSIAVHFMSGLFADLCGSMVWTPMEVIKLQMMVQQKQVGIQQRYSSSYNAFWSILCKHGPRGLYRGFGAGLMTYGPYVGIYFSLYERLKAFSSRVMFPERKELPFPIFLGSAAIASTISAVVTCPLDVAKTRLQVQDLLFSEGRNNGRRYRHLADAILRIFLKEGGKAFFSGLSARMVWMAGGTSLTMAFYEELKKVTKRGMEAKSDDVE